MVQNQYFSKHSGSYALSAEQRVARWLYLCKISVSNTNSYSRDRAGTGLMATQVISVACVMGLSLDLLLCGGRGGGEFLSCPGDKFIKTQELTYTPDLKKRPHMASRPPAALHKAFALLTSSRCISGSQGSLPVPYSQRKGWHRGQP